MKILLAVIAALYAWPVHGATYVSPVATAKVKDRVFSTTTAFRNHTRRDVSCEAIYSGPRNGGNETLRTRYEVPAGKAVTEENTLMEVGAIGTMRFVCSDEILIAARIQTSTDNGVTFDVGRVFPAVTTANAAAATPFEVRTPTHESELLLMQARWGNPLMRDAFAQFFGMSHDQVDVSGLKLYWNSLWHHKTDIALSAGFTIAMLAPRPPVPAVRTTPKVNLMRGGVTPPSGATSTLVEGGGLAAHESAGGHLIERHVAQTPAQLRARLAAEPRVPAVSTFIDRAVAESAVDTTLQANQAQISAWMRSASTRPLVINHTLARPTGLSLARGATTPTTVSGVRLVLVKDATMPMGYRVHTGFPIP